MMTDRTDARSLKVLFFFVFFGKNHNRNNSFQIEKTKKVIKLLLSRGARLDVTNTEGVTPLHLARSVTVVRNLCFIDVDLIVCVCVKARALLLAALDLLRTRRHMSSPTTATLPPSDDAGRFCLFEKLFFFTGFFFFV